MFKLKNLFFGKNKKYTIVISGGGTRGFYALGVLKGLEQLKLDKNIQAMYGVSIGALIGAYRSSGYKADEIYDKFVGFKMFSISKLNFLLKKSLLKNDGLKSIFQRDLPSEFRKLSRKLFVGTTDLNKANYILFDKGKLIPALLGSMAIPGAFPPVEFEKYLLADGGIIDNFPVDFAKKKFPKNEIIGIELNKFRNNQNIKSIIDVLVVALEVGLRSAIKRDLKKVKHAFYRDLHIGILSTNKKTMRNIFELGYKDCLEHFSK